MLPLPAWRPLDRCTPATRELLASSAEPLDLAPGECLIQRGERPDHVFLLREGVLRVFHGKEDGTQFTVKLLRGPLAVGVVEVVRESPWIASVEVLGRAEGLRIPAASVQEAMARDHRFSLDVMAELAEMFESTMQMTRVLGFDDCNTRLARILLDYAEQFGRPDGEAVVIRFALSRERLSREIGAARRSVDRGLEKLAHDQLVTLSPRGWLTVHDLEKLRSLVAEHSGSPLPSAARR